MYSVGEFLSALTPVILVVAAVLPESPQFLLLPLLLPPQLLFFPIKFSSSSNKRRVFELGVFPGPVSPGFGLLGRPGELVILLGLLLPPPGLLLGPLPLVITVIFGIVFVSFCTGPGGR